MKDFADMIGGVAGPGKSVAEIRATTPGAPNRKRQWTPPEGWQYGAKLAEWDASLPVGAEDLLERCEPRNDRILVALFGERSWSGSIVLTDSQPLIGGCREAVVLKVGPGRWMPGEWQRGEWVSGWRRPMEVKPGDVVLIGNWVDLEANGLALAQEGDIRAIVCPN